MIKERTFEDWLQEFHIKLYPQILDDDLPDAFNDWLQQLDVDELLRYGNLFAKEQNLAGQSYVLNKFNA